MSRMAEQFERECDQRQLQEQEEEQQFNLTQKENNMNTNTNINSMSFDQLVPTESKYLSKNDVGEDGVILTIKGFRQETISGDAGDETKVVMHFEEDYKPMVVNRTNSQLIGICTGAATAGDARGKQIVVYNDPTISFGGKVTGGLRIKKIAGAPKQASRPESSFADFDADIPFN